jgi:predicted short-subunit dehydrogenase-like oxidoreductase (DUF2520 family)
VGIVGPGRVGRTLARALERRGVRLAAVVGRRDDPSALAGAETVLLTVPDDAIGGAFVDLARRRALHAGQVVLHCSGLVVSDVLVCEELVVRGRGSMHPMLAFADVDRALSALPGTTYGVEGDAVGEAAAEALVEVLDGSAVRVPARSKAHYHLACVMASNGLVALTDMAEHVMRLGGVGGAGVAEGLAGLVQGTAGNMAALGIRPAMTGPVVRGDAATVRGHLDILAGADDPGLREAYRVLMTRLVQMASEAGRGDPELYRPILEMLEP